MIFAILLAWNDFKNYRAARAIGAVLPPRILDYSPGNIYTIWKEIKSEEKGYVGEFLFSFFSLLPSAHKYFVITIIIFFQVMDLKIKQRFQEDFHSI